MTQQGTVDGMCPNIAWLRKTSYRFWNFYVCAQACTPSRATLLTGLYAPQTGTFTTLIKKGDPELNSNFPTFGTALHEIAGYDQANIMWFGKWHVSNKGYGEREGTGTDTLPNYGFNKGRSSQILWPSYYGSPDGTANQGNNGYLYKYNPPTSVGNPSPCACDNSIVNDFVNNWNNHRTSENALRMIQLVDANIGTVLSTAIPGFDYTVSPTIQIWTALIAILPLKWLHHLSKARWSLSNLASMRRMNLFTYRDLNAWLDNPFGTPPLFPESQQLTLDPSSNIAIIFLSDHAEPSSWCARNPTSFCSQGVPGDPQVGLA